MVELIQPEQALGHSATSPKKQRVVFFYACLGSVWVFGLYSEINLKTLNYRLKKYITQFHQYFSL